MNSTYAVELRAQQPDKTVSGVAVKLYKPKLMTSLSANMEKDYHTGGCRVWMDQEYDILTRNELKELRAFWNRVQKNTRK